MATIFPLNPQVNDEFQGYRWNGVSWEVIGIDLTADYPELTDGLLSENVIPVTIARVDDVNNSLGDYIPLTEKGEPLGVATLDASGYIPSEQLAVDLSGYATESYVNTAVSNLVDSAPETLNTLNELAAALGDDANYATTISTALGNKLDSSVAASTYQPIGSYLTSETDPVFSASPAGGILSADITNWNNAYSWGDHALEGYITSFTETDPIFTASEAYNITSTDTTNWDSAYGWGDHSLVGYLTTFTETDPIFTASEAYSITSTDKSNWNTAYGWGDHSTEGYATETYVGTAIANLVDSAPTTLDTLNELAAALGDDPNYATTISTALGNKLDSSTAASTYAPINNPTFTGTVSGITKSMVGLGNVENTAISTWAGSTNITMLGTITAGTWSGSTIGTTKGGTGLTSIGSAGQVLKVNSGATALEWGTVDSLPSQTGNAGKYLTTNGTSASWATVSGGTADVTSDIMKAQLFFGGN